MGLVTTDTPAYAGSWLFGWISLGRHIPVNSDQVLSEEDLPATAGSGDRRQVIRIRDVSPDVQIVDISQVGRDWDSRQTVWGAGHPKDSTSKRMQDPLAFRPRLRKSGLKMTLRD